MTIRVALLYDTQAWILNYIALSLQKHVSRSGGVEIVPLQAPRKRRELLPLVREYDVIHFLSPGDFYRLGPATTRPSVVTVHHVATRINTRLNELAHETDALCVINKEAEALTKKLPGVKGIPMFFTAFGIDSQEMCPHEDGRRRLLAFLQVPPETILLGLAAKKNSNEDERKGLDRYWKLLENLQEKFGDKVRLVLFGPGKEREYGWRTEDFPEQIRHLVIPTGFVPSEDVPLYYSGLDYYLCLSRIEGGPYPVMECMACGTRVISTRVGIVEELLCEGETGFLVSEGDYLEKIPRLLQENPLNSPQADAMKRLAREAAVTKRSWEVVAHPDVYAKVYQTAINRYRQRPLLQRLAKQTRLSLAVLKG